MAQNHNILQELRELESALANAPFANPFEVPVNYFENLPGLILNRIRALEASNAADELAYLSPFLSTVPKTMPYSIPAGYFEELSQEISAIIGINGEFKSPKDELEAISPLLSGIGKEMPNYIPEGYFQSRDTFAKATASDGFGSRESAYAEASTDKGRKVVSFAGRKWFRYAAAAVLIGIIATFAILLSTEKVDPTRSSYSWIEKNVKKVSTDELENFIQMTDESAQKDLAASTAKTNEVKQLIKDIPNEELQEFLSEIPQEEDAGDELMN